MSSYKYNNRSSGKASFYKPFNTLSPEEREKRIIDFRDFDPSRVKIQTKTYKNGTRYIKYMNNNGKLVDCYLRLPKMKPNYGFQLDTAYRNMELRKAHEASKSSKPLVLEEPSKIVLKLIVNHEDEEIKTFVNKLNQLPEVAYNFIMQSSSLQSSLGLTAEDPNDEGEMKYIKKQFLRGTQFHGPYNKARKLTDEEKQRKPELADKPRPDTITSKAYINDGIANINFAYETADGIKYSKKVTKDNACNLLPYDQTIEAIVKLEKFFILNGKVNMNLSLQYVKSPEKIEKSNAESWFEEGTMSEDEYRKSKGLPPLDELQEKMENLKVDDQPGKQEEEQHEPLPANQEEEDIKSDDDE